MRTIYGLNMHKDSVFVCILNENSVLFQEKFGILTSELENMVSVLHSYSISEVCLENTAWYVSASAMPSTTGKASCEVLDTTAKWFGICCRPSAAVEKIRSLADAGRYPGNYSKNKLHLQKIISFGNFRKR